ncbi:MAG: hypothetical protein I8H72_04525 [Myxococcaceae bacterium]|nr:hypothetical protein [Myxococcaceae bacterium]
MKSILSWFVCFFYVAQVNLFAGDIHEAVKQGEIEIVRLLLKQDPSRATELDESGETPLFYAQTTDIMFELVESRDSYYLKALDFFYQAEESERKAKESLQSINYVGSSDKKSETNQLRHAIIELLSSSGFKSDTVKLHLLFKCFARLLQLQPKLKPNSADTTPACMLCFRDCRKNGYKIAGSHWITESLLSLFSSHFVIPGINRPLGLPDMTLPLLCTGGPGACEQRLNKLGESLFHEQFTPFLLGVHRARSRNHCYVYPKPLKYGPWLFHTISSLAYRAYLSGLSNRYNFISMTDPKNQPFKARNAIWSFVSSIREFLADDAIPIHKIYLYISDKGLLKQEPGLVDMYGLTGFPWIIYSISGFHFFILPASSEFLYTSKLKNYSSEIYPSELLLYALKLQNYLTEIYPIDGVLSVNIDSCVELPEWIQNQVNKFIKNLCDDMGALNHDIIAKKFGRNIEDTRRLLSDNPDYLEYPKYNVKLPDFLIFEPSNSSGAIWAPGAIQVKGDFKLPLVAFHRSINDSLNWACWVWKSLAVVQHNQIVTSYVFDHEKLIRLSGEISKNQEKRMNYEGEIDISLKQHPQTDSARVTFTHYSSPQFDSTNEIISRYVLWTFLSSLEEPEEQEQPTDKDFEEVDPHQKDWYTDDQIKTLLERLLPEEEGYRVIAPATAVFENAELLQNAIGNAVELVLNGKTVVMPIFLHGNHWAGMVLRMQASGALQVIINNPTGSGIEQEKNALILVSALQHHGHSLTALAPDIIDLHIQQQNNTHDCGPFTTDNLVILAGLGARLDGLDRNRILEIANLQQPPNGYANEIRAAHDLIFRAANTLANQASSSFN